MAWANSVIKIPVPENGNSTPPLFDVMVAIGSNFFYTVTLPCTLWFLDRGKAGTDRHDKVLFLDARHIYTQIDDLEQLFLDDTPLLDVRAPVEFAEGAFPHAENLPLVIDSGLLGVALDHPGDAPGRRRLRVRPVAVARL